MRRRAIRLAMVGLALAGISGSAGAAITLYDATQLAYDRYQIVKRLWVGSWRTAIGVPHASTREAAVQDLVQAAENAGADALVNVYCVGGTPSLHSYYCYGDAVRLKQKP